MDNLCEHCGNLANKRCNKCKFLYCSRECQKKDYPVHRDICKSIPEKLAFDPKSLETVSKERISYPFYKSQMLIFIPEISTGYISKNMHSLDSERGKEVLEYFQVTREYMKDYKFVMNLNEYRSVFPKLSFAQVGELAFRQDCIKKRALKDAAEKLKLNPKDLSHITKKLEKHKRAEQVATKIIDSAKEKHAQKTE